MQRSFSYTICNSMIGVRGRSYTSIATTATRSRSLRIGYVPEHFSTPLHFAQQYFGLDAFLQPFPSGTGHMIKSLKASEIDVGVGLTEGWVAGLSRDRENAGFKLVGTYVETPLCWAVSTGAKRPFNSVDDLRSGRMGVSRIGSGSFVMGHVLASQQGWMKNVRKPAFQVVELGTFSKLRDSVNSETVDYFLWEDFTCRKFFDNGDIKRIGEISTPWSSWKIVAREPKDARLRSMFESINQGISYFNQNREEAIDYITTELEYATKDAYDWLQTVRFSEDVRGVDPMVIKSVIETLVQAGFVSDSGSFGSTDMIAIKRDIKAN